MKKTFLLFLGILCSLGMFADDILFSMSSPTGPTDNVDSKTSANLVATYIGGSAIVYNGKSSAAAMVSNSMVNLAGSGNSYLKVTMSGNSFQEGDSILISTAGTFYVSSSTTKGSLSCDANGKYVVTAGDALIGGTDVYIWKNGAKNFASLTIVRPTAASSSEGGSTEEEPTVTSVETPTFASINGTVAISCATDGATVQYSLDGTNYSNYTIPVTLTSNGKVYAKASVGTVVSEVASIDVTAVAAKEGSSSITLYYNTTDMTAASDAPKGLTGNAGTDYEGWGVSVAANTSGTYDKSMSYGSEINGNVTLKGSNGRQTIITMPEGVKANRITLYSYVNNSDTDKDSYWKEVCGTSYNTESEIALASRAAETPDVRVFALDNVTGTITVNNAGYQQCFYAVVDYTVAPVQKDSTLVYASNGSLTFAYDATASREIYEFGGIYNNQVYGTPTTNIVAGKPYIVTAGDDLVLSYTEANEVTTGSGYNGFYGVLGSAATVTGDSYMVFYDGNLYYASEEGTEIPVGRAYFQNSEIPAGVPSDSAKALFGFNLDDYSTDINTVTAALKSNTPVYNISGQRVNSVKQGGVYLVNGKKVVVK